MVRYDKEPLWNVSFVEGHGGYSFADRDLLDELSRSSPLDFERLMRALDNRTKDSLLEKLPKDQFCNKGGELYDLPFTFQDFDGGFLGTVTYVSSAAVFHILCAYRRVEGKIPKQSLNAARMRHKTFKFTNDPSR